MTEAAIGHAAALAQERRMLWISTAAAGVFAVLGIGWGLVARSQMILFDGVYALIGLVLAGLSLRAAALVERGPTHRYPFGREALGPLVVGVQGLVLLGTFGYAILDAVLVILSGGGETALGPALVYAAISLVGSALAWWVLRRGAEDSELVAAEVAQWASGVLFGLGMFVGFGLALALDQGPYAWLAPYLDPIMVIVAAVAFLPTPVRMLRTTYRELLEATPATEVTEPIHAAVAAVGEVRGLPEPTTRIGKLGRKLYIELDYLVEDGRWSVADADVIRRDLLSRLHKPGQLLWLNVELHTDPLWDS